MKIAIVGSGMAGVGVAEELLKNAPGTDVTLFTVETDGYYSRPLLSHGFSRTDIETRIVLKSFAALEAQGLKLKAGAWVTAIDPRAKTVSYKTANTETVTETYETLILATGSEASIPGIWQNYRDQFQVLNSLRDLVGLRRKREAILKRAPRPHWAIVGGGLIGCEVASDFCKAGDQVTIYHAVDRLMERQLTPESSARLFTHLGTLGIEVRLNQAVKAFSSEGDCTRVETDTTRDAYDGVLVATGFRPRVELAKVAGLETDRGIITDNFLRTSDSSIYAVGDVAQVNREMVYAYVLPIRSQALWLGKHLAGKLAEPWTAPPFKAIAKIHGFKAD